ncbi:hypothetical protein HBE96_21970 [Clostridium sp. P21]|uniref:Uncharacterized protein n=1 Tax=Clostridium muellerianum TaxID=2716538 RepID=A0A7Y0EKQ5_9CLOT|nr:hypothetical protein [Clostridium muellerianum]NMM65255.1 hypothetical protein [Clostridium muellerianum]
MKGKVYCEVLKEYKVPSSNDEKAIYLVRYGYVDWYRDGNKRLAVYILMQYNSRIKYINPAHLLVEKDKNGRSDFSRVMKMIGLLMREFKLSDRTK